VNQALQHRSQSSDDEQKQQFSVLWLAIAPQLTNFVYAMLRTQREAREDTRDIVAETALIAWKEFSTLRNETVFFSWVMTIARRLVFQKQRRSKLFDWFDTSKHEYGTEDSPYSADVERLYQAMERLPFEQREAIMLFDVMGFSLDEICTMQKSGLSAVKSRLKRGRERLAILLGVANDTDTETVSLSQSAQTHRAPVHTSDSSDTLLHDTTRRTLSTVLMILILSR
jgi:RNA polymerase sigma-70 factor (ECF subfamily)